MPNFGKLTQDLIGGSLRINDTLVIDQNLNLIIGNVMSSTLSGPLFTPSLTEQNSMQGISVFGNLAVQPGWFLTGEIVSQGITATGPSVCEQSLTVQGVLSAAMITSDTLMIDSMLARNELDINVVGNLVIIDGASTFTGNVLAATIGPSRPSALTTFTGNVFFDQCVALSKAVNPPGGNTISSTKSAGLAQIIVVPSFVTPNNSITFTINNPCITATSIVMAVVGNFVGSGAPIVRQTSVTTGSVAITVQNVGVSNITTNIPLQYLIL